MSHVMRHASHVTRHTSRRQSYSLYSGGRDKAVHHWQGTSWGGGGAEGLVFSGNALPPPCGDVVVALAAHYDCNSSSSSSSTVVAGTKHGCIQTWRGGRGEGSTSIGHGQVNALQVRPRVTRDV